MTTRPLPDRIREALAKARESAQRGDFDQLVKGQAALVFIADNIEALLADNDRLRRVAEAAREWLYAHKNDECQWPSECEELGLALAALAATTDTEPAEDE